MLYPNLLNYKSFHRLNRLYQYFLSKQLSLQPRPPIMSQEEVYQDENDELFEYHRIEVDPKQSLLRIDKFLMDRLANVTRNKVQTSIKDGFVKVNDQPIKPNYRVHPKDVITVSFPEPPRDTEVIPEDI